MHVTFPVWIRLGPLTLHPHWVFETLAYTLASYVYARDRRRRGDVVETRIRWWVIGAAAVGGLVGSRLLYLVEDPVELMRHWSEPAYLAGGKTIVGGLVGGLIAVEWIKRRFGVMVATGDLLVTPLVLGIFVGRIGCFLSGLADRTYGVATALPWGVDFGDGVARHPTQLYEMAFLAGLAVVLATVAYFKDPGLPRVGAMNGLSLLTFVRVVSTFTFPVLAGWLVSVFYSE